MNRTQFKELTISNAFLFSAVMADEEICRRVIELALGIPIAKVHVCTEKTMAYHPEYHGIRLDVYAADEKRSRFNIEMQVVFQRYLPKRSRYYHSQLDMDALCTGETYENLPDTYVIFICDFDPFGKGLYRYTCRTKCEEENFAVDDGIKTIYLNARGQNSDDVPSELVNFLQYVRASWQESEADFQDSFVRCLQEKVKSIKADRSMEERYMLLEEMMRNERKEGLEKGRLSGIAESLLIVLRKKGTVSPALCRRITEENNVTRLSEWLSVATDAVSVEEFEQKM